MTIIAGSLATAADVNAALGLKANAANPNLTGTMTLAGTGPITGFGSGIGQALWLTQFGGSGFPGFVVPGRLIIAQAAPAANDYAVLHLKRSTSFTAAPGTGSSSILHLEGSLGASDSTYCTGVTTTFSTAGAGGVVGAQLQATRLSGSTGNIWGSISDAVDQTGLSTSASGAMNHAGVEIDLEMNSGDDATNGAMVGGTGIRKGIHMVAMRYDSANTTQTEVSNGIWATTGTAASPGVSDSHTNYQSFIGFGINTQLRIALDTRGAITPAGESNPVSAVTMTHGHVIDFNGGALLTSAPGNYWWYDTGTSKMKYNVGATTVLSIDNSGNVRALGTITASVTP